METAALGAIPAGTAGWIGQCRRFGSSSWAARLRVLRPRSSCAAPTSTWRSSSAPSAPWSGAARASSCTPPCSACSTATRRRSAPAPTSSATSTATAPSPASSPAPTASSPTPRCTGRCSSACPPDTYHLGAEVTGFAQDAAGVTVEVAGHDVQRGDALVCADGIHSTARRRLVPDVEPVYAGYVGWRGTVVESRLSEEAFATFADAITYCVLPNSHILVYPIPSLAGSLEPGERLINWVWYRNASPRELDRLLVDRAGVRHAVSVGSGDVREDVLEGLLADAALRLPPQLAELVAKSPEPFVQVVFDIAVPHMAFERIALIGDAAFALRPHVAVGTAKAAEDAWTLAAALAERGRRRPRHPARLGDGPDPPRPVRHGARARCGGALAVRQQLAGRRPAPVRPLRGRRQPARAERVRPRTPDEESNAMSSATEKGTSNEVRDGMRIEWDVPIAMDDGLVLRADVFRPVGDGRYPVILTYGPYAKGLPFQEGYPSAWERMVEKHPDVAAGSTQQVPELGGRRPGEVGAGRLRLRARRLARLRPVAGLHRPLLAARDPGLRTTCIEWAGVQPWSNGKVGLDGISYYAMNQWQVAGAAARRTWRRCACGRAPSDWYRDSTHHGGILSTFWTNWYDMQVKTVQYGLGERGPRQPATPACWCAATRRWPRTSWRATGRTSGPRSSPTRSTTTTTASAQRDWDADDRAAAVRRQLGRPGAAPARQRRGLRARRVAGQVARDARRRALDALLHRLRRGHPEALLRPLPQGRGHRLATTSPASCCRSATPTAPSPSAPRASGRSRARGGRACTSTSTTAPSTRTSRGRRGRELRGARRRPDLHHRAAGDARPS